MSSQKKAAIYVRVSTVEQNSDNQLKILKEYCVNNEYEIISNYIDKGESGLKESRPEFNRLLKDLRARRFNTVVVWKLDRIGRSLQHLLQILQEFNTKRIDLVVITQNIDTTTATGKLMFQLIGAFAEFESSLISERTKLGMDRAKKQGKRIGRPKKNQAIYNHYCIVSGCRVKVERTCKVCKKHKHLEKHFTK